MGTPGTRRGLARGWADRARPGGCLRWHGCPRCGYPQPGQL